MNAQLDVQAFVRTFSVGKYLCVVSIPRVPYGVALMSVEWTPSVPLRMTAIEEATYQRELLKAISDSREGL